MNTMIEQVSEDVIISWISQASDMLLSDQYMWIPLIFSIGGGYVYNLWLQSGHTGKRRLSDRKFRVYAMNIFICIVSFTLVADFEVSRRVLTAQYMLIISASIFLPLIHFEVISRVTRNSRFCERPGDIK